MSRRIFDEPFKRMALDLAHARGSIKDVAIELGISSNLLSKWKEREGIAKADTTSLSEEQQLIRKLQKELKEAQLERDILKKAVGIFSKGDGEIFGFIKDYRKIFSVERMCRVFGINNSSFYYWLKNPQGKRLTDDNYLMIEISKIYAESKGCYGSPRITAELCSRGIFISRPRVARLMRRLGIKSTIRKKWVQTTDSQHTYSLAENFLNRDFYAANIREKWVSDLTYIQTGEGWLYLTTVIDLADRKVVGWSLSENMEAENTTIKALEMAIKNRPITQQLIFHSDRGIQYACSEFRKKLECLGIKQSMSRKGNCWDNAVAESFFKTIKTEMIYQQIYKTRAKASLAIFEYIEVWYNRKRRHSYLGYLSPLEFANSSINPKIAA